MDKAPRKALESTNLKQLKWVRAMQIASPLSLSKSRKLLLPHILRKVLRATLPAVLAALFIRVFVTQAMVVQGSSMKPNLSYNYRVMVEKFTYRFVHGPRRGDVVVIDMPEENTLLVKRAVALPGETVTVQDGQVFINGQPLEEPWVIRRGGIDYPPTLVPPGHVFVLGDNREESLDSRYFGPVPIDEIDGQVRFIIWPPDHIGELH